MAHHWPLFDLRVRTARLELRLPTDDDLPALIEAGRDIHDDDEMPFATPWTRLRSPDFERNFLKHHWSTRARCEPEHWSLPLAVVADGVMVGCQDIAADDFAILRTARTGSWLARAHQGCGIGTEMRAAILHLAFEGLDAQAATSEAFVGNNASAGVSGRLGYVANGREHVAVEGRSVLMERYLLTAERWRETRAVEVQIEGLDGCLELLGAA